MSGSVAEERIRAKAEAALRERHPDARIVHELVLDQGGVRIDLAAVTPDRLVVAEIKSERDTLKRLKSQVTTALSVAQEVWVFVAERHAPALERLSRGYVEDTSVEPVISKWDGRPCYPSIRNPDQIDGLRRCLLRVEAADGWRIPGAGYDGAWGMDLPNYAAALQMLHAAELRWLTQRVGSGPRTARGESMRLALEHLTGREIRRGICACVRGRHFPRADEARAA